MVTLTEKTVIISIDSTDPAETLTELQKAIIEALKAQYRDAGYDKPVTIESETGTANFYLLTLLENLMPSTAELRDGLSPDAERDHK